MRGRNRNGNGKKSPEKEVRRCAIYTRKSTTAGLEQEFNTLHAQREACELYIKAKVHEGWQILDEHYDDGGFTGANIERPAFQRLLADIGAGRIDVVVVYKVDRLSRSLLDFAQVMDRFNRADVAFVSVTQNFSTSDSIGMLTLNMLMSFATFERDMIAERTRDKIAASRRKGKWTGGPVPLGYEIKDKHIVINPVEAPVVMEVFDLYLAHQSVMGVVRILNRMKRKMKLHRARNGNVRGGGRWHKNGVLRVLRNPLYAGYMPLYDELYEGEHEAIMDRDKFERVQVLLDRLSECRPKGGRNPAYLLTGMLRCACGGAMSPASTRTRGKEYRYYRCATRDNKGTEVCAARSLPAGAIEDFVLEQIRGAVGTPDMAERVENELVKRIEAQRGVLRKDSRNLKECLREKKRKLQHLSDEFKAATGKDRTILEGQVDYLAREMNETEESFRSAKRKLVALDQAEVDGRWVASMLRDFKDVWDVLSVENRRRLILAIVSRVVVDDDAGTVEVEFVDLAAELPSCHDDNYKPISPSRTKEASQ